MHRARAIVWVFGLGVAIGCGKSGPEGQPIAERTAPELGWEIGKDRAERAPISLTASDGSGLTLVSVSARAVIEDPLAFTELHLKFRNTEPRRREGRFEIALPQGAAVSRFAMRIGDSYQEGEVVPRQRAQQIYEDFLHRRQDPALLENEAGNEFAARVFPIEPNSDKELILAYSQELPHRDAPYELMLQGLPKLEKLDVEVQVGGSRARSNAAPIALHERDYVPAADLQVRLPRQRPVALRNGNLVVARVVPVLQAPVAAVTGLTVLFDTSASRSLGFGAQIERLGALLGELQKFEQAPIEVRVIAFDQTAEEVFRGPVSEFGLRAKARLLARDALGASNLGEALAFAAEGGAGHRRMLLVGDGVITAGIDDSTRLREAVARLAAHGVRRLDVLAEGGITDRETLRVVTQAGLAEAGVVLEARAPVATLADRLRKAVRERIQVGLAGATWVYPDTLDSVQPGDERLVFAELPEGVPVQIELVGAGAEAYDTLETPRPLLERAWARAKIESRTRALRALPVDAESARAAIEREITELSVQNRVVSEFTAMLVLEGPAEYVRYGLTQNALTSILRVSDRGLEVWDRREQPVLQIARDFDDRPGLARDEAATEGFGGVERRRAGGGAVPSDLAAARGALPERKASSGGPPSAAKGEAAVREEEAEAPRRAARPSAESDRSRESEPQRQAPSAPRAFAANEVEAPVPASSRGIGSGASPVEASASREKAKSYAGRPMGELLAGPAADRMSDERVASKPQLAAAEPAGAPVPAPVQIAVDAFEPRLELAVLMSSNLSQSDVQRALRGSPLTRARQCFAQSHNPGSRERVGLNLVVSDKGTVSEVYVATGSLSDRAAQSCAVRALHSARLPKPESGRGTVQVELSWSMKPVAPQSTVVKKPAGPRRAPVVPAPNLSDAYDGVLADVLARLQQGDTSGALARASAAHGDDPADVIGLVALGEALEAQRDYARAARAYGSLIDLFPSRADLRRMAAQRLERLPTHGLALAVDSYRRAAQQRPDQPSGPRGLAYALLKQSDRAQAFETLERALERGYDENRFDGVQRILREDLGLVGAAWMRVDPSAQERVRSSLAAHGAEISKSPSTRFVLQWETDANDVDFHIYDGQGGHAYYMRPRLPSGGALYADITTGYGPECFAIAGKARAYPYVLQAHYFARGPMGYGMGRVQVIEHDGAGNLRFGEFPFVIMKDKAFVELARLNAPLP